MIRFQPLSEQSIDESDTNQSDCDEMKNKFDRLLLKEQKDSGAGLRKGADQSRQRKSTTIRSLGSIKDPRDSPKQGQCYSIEKQLLNSKFESIGNSLQSCSSKVDRVVQHIDNSKLTDEAFRNQV
jgi:hypothetical protein